MENWSFKGCIYEAQPYGKPLWESQRYIRIGPAAIYQQHLLDLEGDWSYQVDIPVCSLELATWCDEMSEHQGSALMQRGWVLMQPFYTLQGTEG